MRSGFLLSASVTLALFACAPFPWSKVDAGTPKVPVSPPALTLRDIVETRSIDSLSASPDGKLLAFRVITPSLDRNSNMARWFVVAVDGKGTASPLGVEAEPIWMPVFDVAEAGVSEWAPDSGSLFVLGLQDSQIQVHRLGLDGKAEQITSDEADVVSFELAPDKAGLRYKVRNPRTEIDRLQAEEELEGVHLDASVFTEGYRLTGNHQIGERVTTVRGSSGAIMHEAHGGALREKSVRFERPIPAPAARSTVGEEVVDPLDKDAAGHALALDGRDIRLQLAIAAQPNIDPSSYRIVARDRDGAIRTCREAPCAGNIAALRQVTVNRHLGEVVIFHEQDFSARSKLYGWTPATGKVRLIADAEGSWDSGPGYGQNICPRIGPKLYCVASGPLKAPKLVSIDLASGAIRTMYDPNASLDRRLTGEARYLEWRDDHGRPANGVLLLPPGSPKAVPLVITTYRCRGLLRGGTSWLAPEPLVVERGMAALCVNNVNSTQFERDPAGNRIALAQHRAALDAYAAIIGRLGREGIIDPERVGIAGHSYSAGAVGYAISHSDLFKTAIIGGGIPIEASNYFLTGPTADSWRKGFLQFLGMPRPTDDPEGKWAEISPSLNATKIKASLLMLPPESEYLPTLQLYANLTDAGGAVDMYIFPRAGHLPNRKPVQQYWRERRALDWLEYWLMGRSSEAPETKGQFSVWDKLQADRRERMGEH